MTSHSDDLRELIDRCLAGDAAALRGLVHRFQGPVFGLCYRMLGSVHDAEDVAQESLVRAIRHLGRWDSRRDFLPWLLAIAGNRCRTHLARRMQRPAAAPLWDDLPERDGGLQAARQLAEEVELALRSLRAEYRQAFLLFHEQELSYAEIGTVLDCPVGTVKTWVYRARQELIERLRQRGVAPEVRDAMRKI